MAVNKKVLTKDERCQVMVSPPGMWGAFQEHQCYNKAVVTCDGKRYCKIHSPQYLKAKREAQDVKFNRETAVRRIQFSGHMLLAACKEALEASHNPIVEKILMKAISKAEGG